MKSGTSFWELLTENRDIVIPSLQRDYTHGRNGESPEGQMATQVRNAFLASIDSVLQGRKAYICMDFMFGPQTEDRFLPIDGQQRLTTLFLYHWYLLPKEEDISPLQRFEYKTRDTSNEFCKLLARTRRSSVVPVNGSISEGIKNLGLFFLRWRDDPTVSGMLTVIDEIHNRWKKEDHSVYKKAWQRLTDFENPGIYFFIPDNENNRSSKVSTDFEVDEGAADLYIRMNARGKPLTPFEQFKAWLEEYVDKPEENSTPLSIENWEGTGRENGKKSWKALLDSEWTDLFWEHDDGNHVVDEEFLRFFTTVAVCDYACENDFAENRKDGNERVSFKSIAPEEKDESYVPTHLFENENIFNDRNLRLAFTVLDALSVGGEAHIRSSIEDLERSPILSEHEGVPVLLEKIVKPNPTYANRIRFYTIARFIGARHEAVRSGDKNTADEIARFSRIVDNIVGNLQIEDVKDFTRRIKQMDRLIQKMETALKNENLPAVNPMYNVFVALSEKEITDIVETQNDRLQEQLTEEQKKCRLIVEDSDTQTSSWEEVIVDAETKEFTRGRIDFLLNYVERSAQSNTGTEEERKSTLKKYAGLIDAMFHQNRTVYDAYSNERTPQPEGEYRSTFLLRRALLTKGYFNFKWGSNWSFCGNPNDAGAERRQWYSKGFSMWEGETPLMYRVLTDVADRVGKDGIGPKPVKDALENIVNDYLEEHPTPDDWRWWFISFPELFKYSEYNETRWHNNDKLTYILKRSRLNGRHVEMVSYSFYRDVRRHCPPKEDNPVSPDRSKAFPPFRYFGYYEPSNGSEKPCMYLDRYAPHDEVEDEKEQREYAMDVHFDGNSHDAVSGEFVLTFFDRNSEEQLPTELKKTLTSLGFRSSEKISYEKRVKITQKNWRTAPRKAIEDTCKKLEQFF